MRKKRGKLIVHDVIIPLDLRQLAADPRRYLEKILKGRNRPRQLLLKMHGTDTLVEFDDIDDIVTYFEK